MNLLKELEKVIFCGTNEMESSNFLQDPFDPDDFVERLARHSMLVQDSTIKGFDISLLHETFTKIIV